MDPVLGIIGVTYIAFKMMILLLMVGFAIWFLAQVAGFIFKILFYGSVTMLALAGLAWLFVF